MTADKQPDPTPDDADPVSPDALMNDFRGRPLMKIVIVTVLAHALFIGVFSFGYIKRQLVGEPPVASAQDSDGLSKQERMTMATNESETALRQIADRHGLSYRELSASLTGPSGGTTRNTNASDNPPGNSTPGEPGSAYEQNLKRPIDPPTNPDLTGGIEEEEPIFPE